MNIMIIEDEDFAAQRIRGIIEDNVPDAHIVGVYDSVEDSVQFLNSNPMPHLMLTDIELVDGQSFEIFNEVKVTCAVIFTTAYDEFVLKAFSVHSIDYLLKPIQKEDLLRSIQKFRELQKVYSSNLLISSRELLAELRKTINTEAPQVPREYFLIRQGQRLISINVDEIAYFYSEERLTFLKTTEGKFHVIDQPLEELEKQVEAARFFRANRKYLIERRSISNVIIHFNGKLKVVLQPAPKEDDAIVSRERANDFRKWLGG
jgi:two-component system response regulator LytT